MSARPARATARWTALGVVVVLAGCAANGSGSPGSTSGDDPSGPTYAWPTAQDLGYDGTVTPGSHGEVVEHTPSVVDHGTTMRVVPLQTVETDGDETVNQDLSERRAQAVADAVADARPDLSLDVQGFGETRLKRPETGDPAAVAEARAENRRVEIRYGG